MKKYFIEITETLSRVVEIDAETLHDAVMTATMEFTQGLEEGYGEVIAFGIKECSKGGGNNG